MEEKESMTSTPKSPRFSRPILIFALMGLALSGIFIIASFPQILSDQDAGSSLSAGTTPNSSLPQPIGNGKVGELAPDFTLKTLDGGEASLSDFRGRPVLINFWATWCGPCRREMPELVHAYNDHKDEGFVILAVNLTHQDPVENVRDFVEEFEMSFPVLLDEAGQVSGENYRLLGLPMSVFVDRDGMITRIHIGLMTEGQINEFIDEILAA